jgi:hypothetical protein
VPVLDKAKALADIDRVLAHKNDTGGTVAVEEHLMLIRACLARWAPPGSVYLTNAPPPDLTNMKKGTVLREHNHGLGSLRALRHDIEADALADFAELVHADLFSELLGDADHLLAGGYLLAAAVIAGATLEGHIRKLADKHAVPTTDPAGRPVRTANLNDQLAAANVYSRADHDLASGWIRIRNEAAHNEPVFGARTEPEIRGMIDGTRSLVARHPA